MSLTFLFEPRFFGFMVPPLPAATAGVEENAREALRIGEAVVRVGRKEDRRGLRRRKRGDGRVAAMVGSCVVV